MRFLLYFLLILISLVSFSQTDIDRSVIRSAGLSEFQVLQLQNYAKQRGVSLDQNIENLPQKSLKKSKSGEIEDFEEMVNDSIEVKDDLEEDRIAENIDEDKSGMIFGSNLFTNSRISIFETNNVIKASEDYIISYGDEISISIWGYSDYNNSFTVNSEGVISPNRIGRIYLKGMKFGEVKQLLWNKFAEIFDLKNSEMAVSVNYARDIRVNIVGEVNQPGTYSLKGYHTAFNALFAAKGINDLGSYRNIIIKRKGKTFRTLDVYEFLMKPSIDNDLYLEDGDFIIVPSVGNKVTVEGAVKRPMIYELKEGEGLTNLFLFSGGLSAQSFSKNLLVTRVISGELKVLNVNYNDHQKNFELFDGDIVKVRTIPDNVENFVEIDGAVRIPGRYQLVDSMTISDLINISEGLNYDAYLSRVYLIRTDENLVKHYRSFNIKEIIDNPKSQQDLLLKKFDKITVFSKNDFLDSDSVFIRGAVRKPGKYTFGEGMNLKDLLYLSGGLKREAAISRIEVSRIIDYNNKLNVYRPTRTIVKVIEVDYRLQVDEKDALFELKPNDQLFIRTEPIYEEHQNITLIGEVKYPGVYTLLSKNEKLSELLERAGGVTESAFLEGAKLYRSFENLGYMFINLEDLLKNKRSAYDYILKAGDTLFLPKKNDLVSIAGAIEYPLIDSIGKVNAPFLKGKRARYYVKNFGVDFDKKAGAVRRKTIVRLPNGLVNKTRSFGLFSVYPKVEKGSTVIVNSKAIDLEKEEVKKEPVDWNAIFESFTIKVTGILTLYFLIDRVSYN